MRPKTFDLISTALTMVLLDIVMGIFFGFRNWFAVGLFGWTIVSIYECIVRGIVWMLSRKKIYIRKYEFAMVSVGSAVIWIAVAFYFPIGTFSFYSCLGFAVLSLIFSPASATLIRNKMGKSKKV